MSVGHCRTHAGYICSMDSDTKATSAATGETLTVAEAAAYAGVSSRTIERYSHFHEYKPSSEFRNGRKTNVYEKTWLDKVFKSGGQKSDRAGTRQTNADNRPDTNQTDLVNCLTDEIQFLRKEVTIKNEVISKLQDSDKNTKMLLADLQIQNKALQLSAPKEKERKVEQREPAVMVNPVNERESQIWVWLFILLMACIGTGGYFTYNYVLSLMH